MQEGGKDMQPGGNGNTTKIITIFLLIAALIAVTVFGILAYTREPTEEEIRSYMETELSSHGSYGEEFNVL